MTPRQGKRTESWRFDRSIHEISYATLEEWSLWLSGRGLGPKTRWNVMAAFHAFAQWLVKRGSLKGPPPSFPWPKLPQHRPKILSPEDQTGVLLAIEEGRRGIFLCMGLMGLRPGEARALDVADYQHRDRWLDVSRAVKGSRLDAPIRGTKTGEGRYLPVPDDLAEWIENHVPREGRLAGAPLFVNPASGNRWGPTSLRRTWARACRNAGVPWVAPYEGTKHTWATNTLSRGIRIEVVQAMLGHRDRRSTERYAKLRNEALVEAIGPRLQAGYKKAGSAEVKRKQTRNEVTRQRQKGKPSRRRVSLAERNGGGGGNRTRVRSP